MTGKKKNSIVKWIIIGVAIVALGVGGFFGFKAYENYLANKIYAPSENVAFPDFDVKVTKAEFKAVDLPIDKETIKKYGALDKKENCDTFSKEKTWDAIGGNWYHTGPSEFNVCIRRNDARDSINKYTSENKQLTVDFVITAKNNVNSKDLKIELSPDSGRNLNDKVDSLNASQFFPEGAQHIDSSLTDALKAPGPVMTYERDYNPYEAFHKSDLGGDINKDIERKAFIYADIRNSESSVDLKISYHGQTRIVRIKQ